MKRCPSCDSIYLDEYVYCLSDGAALISDMADQPDADTKGRSDGRSAQMPRRAFNPILIYLAIGALTLVAGGLFALDRFSGSSSDTGKIGSSSTDKDYLSSAAQTSIPSPSNRTPFNTKETSGSQPPLTTESVKELLVFGSKGRTGEIFSPINRVMIRLSPALKPSKTENHKLTNTIAGWLIAAGCSAAL